MSIRGLDNRNDHAPTGWTQADQRTWAHPWETGLDEYFDELAERGWLVPVFPPVFGVTAACVPASVDAWPPLASSPPPPGPSGSEPAAAQLLRFDPPA